MKIFKLNLPSRPWLLIFFPTLLVFLLAVYTLGMNYRNNHTIPVEYGVTFSTLYAEELGIDWQTAYVDLLDEMEFKHVRLMSYWNRYEPIDDQFNFYELDWLFAESEKREVKVSLAIGLRQPRWPECHAPSWLNESDVEPELLEYLEVVVSRYKDSSALDSYQLENEVKNQLFGECFIPFDQTRFGNEIALVKKLDPNHDLILNASNQIGTPLVDNPADKVGFSIYRIANNPLGPFRFYFSYALTPPLWHSFRAELVERIVHVPVFVHELQLEPWGPHQNYDLTIAEQDESMAVEDIKPTLDYARRTGITRQYLWGGEWWYWRKHHQKDPFIWNEVMNSIRR